jgi:predicted ATPase/class 3 adenylate cyclase
MNETHSFGYWVRRRRKALDLTQAELAAQVGCAEVTIRRIEADERRPSRQIAQRLANQLALPPEQQAAFIQAARAELGADRLAPPPIVAREAVVPAPAAMTDAASAVMRRLPSGTVTFLFTDIEGSTQLWEQHPHAMPEALAHHDALIRGAIEAHAGVVFRTIGDAVCASFGDAVAALAAALEAQKALHTAPWGATGPVQVRMALHSGVVAVSGDDYLGLSLSRVARVLAAGHGGQILLSRATAELVREHLPPEVALRDLGKHRLKDLTYPEQIYQIVTADLPANFPPLKTLAVHRTNLPTQPTPLIGRAAEVRTVGDLLRRANVRLLTLTGPGGVGKTRLALQAAAEALDGFADGVYFVNLAPIRDANLVTATIAQTLGVKEAGSQPLFERLNDELRNKHLLLLLDNFEQVVDAAPHVAEVLAAAPNVQILVTSRETLHLRGEQEFPVAPLALPDLDDLFAPERLSHYDAVRLFIERAQAVKQDFQVTNATAPTVAEICYRLDGLPLAIELAAARIKFFPPEALLARLEHRLQMLTGGPRDLPVRQQTLRNTIDWSYVLLDLGEQALFRRLGVFVGGCTLKAAAAVCNADGDLPLNFVDGMASLTDKSLLRHIQGPDGEPRFSMLEMISEYALERLEQSGEAQAIRRQHANSFLALAEAAELHRYTPTQSPWLLRLDADHDNMRSALAWSQTAAASVDIGARLAGALQWYWYIRGYMSEGRTWLERVLQQTTSATAPARAKVLYGAGRLQSDAGQANALIEQALTLWRELEDKPGMADALLNLGRVARLQGDYERSGKLVEESLALFREQQIMWGVVWALISLADVALDLGDSAQAQEPVEEVLALTESLGDTYGNMWARCLRGRLAHLQGDLEQAAMLLGESLAWLRKMRNPSRFEMLNDLGRVAFDQGDTDRAAVLFKESLKLNQEPGYEIDITDSLVDLAGVAEALGLPARAARLLGAAESIRQSISGSLTPVKRTIFDRYAATIHARLDEATFGAAWAEGQALTIERAVAYALNESDESECPRAYNL